MKTQADRGRRAWATRLAALLLLTAALPGCIVPRTIGRAAEGTATVTKGAVDIVTAPVR